MSQDRHLSDHDIEQLFMGNAVDPSLYGVATWAAAIRRSADISVGASAVTEHVAAAAAAAAARLPIHPAPPIPQTATPSRLRRVYNNFAARLATVAAVFVLATSGIAAAGVLPDSVQEPLADFYGIAGFDFHPTDTSADDGAGDDGGVRLGEDGDGDIAPAGVDADDDQADDDQATGNDQADDDQATDNDQADDDQATDNEQGDDDQATDNDSDDDQATDNDSDDDQATDNDQGDDDQGDDDQGDDDQGDDDQGDDDGGDDQGDDDGGDDDSDQGEDDT